MPGLFQHAGVQNAVLTTAHRFMALREAPQRPRIGPKPLGLALLAPAAQDRVQFGSAQADRSKAAQDWRTPMPEVRILGQSHGFMMCNFALQQDAVVWDVDTQRFCLRLDFYSNTKQKQDNGNDPYERPLNHGEVLPGTLVAGAMVDQVNKRITLPDGRWIDGPTGNIYSVHGDLLIAKDPNQQPRQPEGKSI